MIIPPELKLETDKVLLRPLQHLDIAPFSQIANDESLWKYFTFLLNEPNEMQKMG